MTNRRHQHPESTAVWEYDDYETELEEDEEPDRLTSYTNWPDQ